VTADRDFSAMHALENHDDCELLEVDELYVGYPMRSRVLRLRIGTVHAVNGVSLRVRPGETLGIVGESGCGKSTLAMALMQLLELESGRIRLDGKDLSSLTAAERKDVISSMQMVFQDPMSSLNPRMTVHAILSEPLIIHSICKRSQLREKVGELLELVGLRAADSMKFPHEFSGGQRQRIGIARALALKPRLIILDEPVSALDVSVQAQIINLLKRLQRELGLAYVFVAHDLSLVRHMCDRVAVMYMGRVVETGPADSVLLAPKHPYTRALVSAIPRPDPSNRALSSRIRLTGEVPSPVDLPSGCSFRTRCPLAEDSCAEREPQLSPVSGTEQMVACPVVLRGDSTE
jgi:oligopeptide/dipeptide ABC transporter ATP-binding protein